MLIDADKEYELEDDDGDELILVKLADLQVFFRFDDEGTFLDLGVESF
jgi:hypothetical protein